MICDMLVPSTSDRPLSPSDNVSQMNDYPIVRQGPSRGFTLNLIHFTSICLRPDTIMTEQGKRPKNPAVDNISQYLPHRFLTLVPISANEHTIHASQFSPCPTIHPQLTELPS